MEVMMIELEDADGQLADFKRGETDAQALERLRAKYGVAEHPALTQARAMAKQWAEQAPCKSQLDFDMVRERNREKDEARKAQHVKEFWEREATGQSQVAQPNNPFAILGAPQVGSVIRTLRDEIAIETMRVLIARSVGLNYVEEMVARSAYRMADAMLGARK